MGLLPSFSAPLVRPETRDPSVPICSIRPSFQTSCHEDCVLHE